MKRVAAMILCAVLFVTAIGAAGMAFHLSKEQSNGLSPMIGSGWTGKTGGNKNTGTFPSLDRFNGKNDKKTPAAQGPWLPDPCNVFGVSGKFVKSQKVSGTTVNYYRYELVTTIDDICHKIANYTWALYDQLDYEIYEMRPTGDMIMTTGMKKNGVMAEMYLGVIDDSNYYSEYSDLTLEVILAVPEPMEFQLGRKTPGIINGENVCPSCEGSKKCEFCHGYGKVNYGAGYETCVSCDGNKYCTICDGSGIIE